MKPAISISAIILLSMSLCAQTLNKTALYIDGTIVDAQRTTRGIRVRTTIVFHEDVPSIAIGPGRFCDDWSKKLDAFRGKYVRVHLQQKEYAVHECLRITSIEPRKFEELVNPPTPEEQAAQELTGAKSKEP